MLLDLSVSGISGWLFKTTLGWIDMPDSLCEVVLSFWLLVATHTALGRLAAFASDALSSPDQPKVSSAKVADSDGPDGTRSGNHASQIAVPSPDVIHEHTMLCTHACSHVAPFVVLSPDVIQDHAILSYMFSALYTCLPEPYYLKLPS